MPNGLPLPALLLVPVPAAALLAGFLFFGRFPRRTHWAMLASCFVVTGCSLWLLAKTYAGASWDSTVYRWALAGPFNVDFGLRIDGLSVSVLSMVCVVGTLIHVYAVGYMAEDPGFRRFFLYFHFFFLSMVGLLVSNNYLQLYVFWEGVGLASYLLIGFWHDKPAARAAAWKAFLVNRVGDIGFLLAVFILLRSLGTVRFQEVFPRASDLGPALSTAVPLLLVWGACAKSAQFPLHVWLPDAMEGPTPVSALMHAATMVAAGVFLLARSMPLLVRSPAALLAAAAVGMLTALGSAFVASVQKDVKRVLAYSTMSHLGIMMIGIGTANVFGAVFHLVVHGFFKGLLFLCAGNLIHGLHARLEGRTSADLDDCGGLARSLPLTFACAAGGAWALSGIPPLSGFWSKEQVLGGAMAAGLGRAYSALAVLLSGASAFYVFRLLFLAFLGRRPERRGPEAGAAVREPGPLMTVPVAVLALFCLGAGAFGAPLARLLGTPEPALPFAPAAAGAGAAFAGLVLAWAWAFQRPGLDWAWRRRWPGFERLAQGEFGWQGAMDGAGWVAAAFARGVGDLWERRTWDVFTESLADVCVGFGEWLSSFSRGLVNQYLWWMLAGVFAFACTGLLWR